jgi:hypothetical protein
LWVSGYRIFFYRPEGKESAHVHVEQAERHARFWLNPLALAASRGFRSSESTELTESMRTHHALFKERSNEHIRDQG